MWQLVADTWRCCASATGDCRLERAHQHRALGFDLVPAEAPLDMIVDQPHGLHEGVAGGWSDEGEAALAQVLAEPDRGVGLGETAEVVPTEIGWTVFGSGLEAPDIGRQRAELALQFESPPGIVDGGSDLAAMTDDARIEQQTLDIALGHCGDPGNVEAMKDLAEALALAQDGDPAQAGLETFEADLFEQSGVAGDWPAPFAVMIVAIERIVASPG